MADAPEKSETYRMNNIDIEIPDTVAEGIYSNLAMIHHSGEDFFVDYIFVGPGARTGKVRARIILSPAHFKRLLSAMQSNLQRYEQAFGTIQDPQAKPPSTPPDAVN